MENYEAIGIRLVQMLGDKTILFEQCKKTPNVDTALLANDLVVLGLVYYEATGKFFGDTN